MHTTTTSLVLTLLLPSALALTLTSPAGNQQINPGLPLTITWTSTPSDPDTISLILVHSSSATDVLATNIDTASGSYTVPAWWVLDYGIGYTLQAQRGSGGDVIAEVGDLTLGGGLGEITTDATGGLSFVSTAAIETASQASAATGGQAVTGSNTSSGDDEQVTILSSTASATAEGTARTSESESAETASSSSSSSSTSESESASASASATGSATAASTADTDAASGVRAAVGGVLGAVAVALMA